MIQIPTTPVPLKNYRRASLLAILQYVILISIILYFGRVLFIPLSFSLLISFILYPFCKWMEKKKISRTIAISVSISVITILIAAIFYLLFIQAAAFSHEWDNLKAKLAETYSQFTVFFTGQFGWSKDQQLILLRKIAGGSGSQILPLIRTMVYSLSETLFLFFLIPIFSALILYHRQRLVNILYRLFPEEKKNMIDEVLIESIHAYYNFIKGMLLVYFIVGILNSIGLVIIGIPHPFFFGFVASILTFIPYIGIIVASLLPITVAWITYSSIWYPLGVILVFSVVQVIEANIIFPFAISSRLNLNTLMVLIAIIAGGILWGAAGMILFIPFIGILKLVADRIEKLKTISILLGK